VLVECWWWRILTRFSRCVSVMIFVAFLSSMGASCGQFTRRCLAVSLVGADAVEEPAASAIAYDLQRGLQLL
jgi:hypothetical protein